MGWIFCVCLVFGSWENTTSLELSKQLTKTLISWLGERGIGWREMPKIQQWSSKSNCWIAEYSDFFIFHWFCANEIESTIVNELGGQYDGCRLWEKNYYRWANALSKIIAEFCALDAGAVMWILCAEFVWWKFLVDIFSVFDPADQLVLKTGFIVLMEGLIDFKRIRNNRKMFVKSSTVIEIPQEHSSFHTPAISYPHPAPTTFKPVNIVVII